MCFNSYGVQNLLGINNLYGNFSAWVIQVMPKECIKVNLSRKPLRLYVKVFFVRK